MSQLARSFPVVVGKTCEHHICKVLHSAAYLQLTTNNQLTAETRRRYQEKPRNEGVLYGLGLTVTKYRGKYTNPIPKS